MYVSASSSVSLHPGVQSGTSCSYSTQENIVAAIVQHAAAEAAARCSRQSSVDAAHQPLQLPVSSTGQVSIRLSQRPMFLVLLTICSCFYQCFDTTCFVVSRSIWPLNNLSSEHYHRYCSKVQCLCFAFTHPSSRLATARASDLCLVFDCVSVINFHIFITSWSSYGNLVLN